MTVEEYFAALPEDKRAALEQLRSVIRAAVLPGAGRRGPGPSEPVEMPASSA